MPRRMEIVRLSEEKSGEVLACVIIGVNPGGARKHVVFVSNQVDKIIAHIEDDMTDGLPYIRYGLDSFVIQIITPVNGSWQVQESLKLHPYVTVTYRGTMYNINEAGLIDKKEKDEDEDEGEDDKEFCETAVANFDSTVLKEFLGKYRLMAAPPSKINLASGEEINLNSAQDYC